MWKNWHTIRLDKVHLKHPPIIPIVHFCYLQNLLLVNSSIDFLKHFRYRVFSKGGNIMTEKELLDMFIQERIAMLIEIFHQKQLNHSEEEYKQTLNTEIFIENLPSKEKALIQNHIDSLIRQFALEEAFLYQHGFMDGMILLKYIDKL